MEVYTIYHKDGHKIGATNEYEKRIKSYPPNTTVVLVELPKDQYTPQQIGDIEWGYADDFGYKRGGHYSIAIAGRALEGKIGGKIVGRKNVESGHLQSISSAAGKIGGKITGRKHVESGHWANIQTFENRSKGGKTMKDKKWFNNGIINKRSLECPNGFIPGMIKISKQ